MSETTGLVTDRDPPVRDDWNLFPHHDSCPAPCRPSASGRDAVRALSWPGGGCLNRPRDSTRRVSHSNRTWKSEHDTPTREVDRWEPAALSSMS